MYLRRHSIIYRLWPEGLWRLPLQIFLHGSREEGLAVGDVGEHYPRAGGNIRALEWKMTVGGRWASSCLRFENQSRLAWYEMGFVILMRDTNLGHWTVLVRLARKCRSSCDCEGLEADRTSERQRWFGKFPSVKAKPPPLGRIRTGRTLAVRFFEDKCPLLFARISRPFLPQTLRRSKAVLSAIFRNEDGFPVRRTIKNNSKLANNQRRRIRPSTVSPCRPLISVGVAWNRRERAGKIPSPTTRGCARSKEGAGTRRRNYFRKASLTSFWPIVKGEHFFFFRCINSSFE